MTASFQRKIIYGVSLAALLLLLYFIGRPAQVVVQADGDMRLSQGGLLAQYRTQEGLTEAQMGELDPAGTTLKLATFGMRGVAIAMLWHQTMEKQKRHEWNDVVATGNQITFLEPHFVTIWEFLGWTLSYNASADFDDYRERYRCVIRGIDFLLNGLKRNQNSPRLHKATGWTVSQKIGIADEVEQYRRLLRDDEDFGDRHGYPLASERDNWLMGRDWYHLGEALVMRGISLGNESDPVYFANSRLNLFNYSKWKRRDGIFGQEAIDAWNWAHREWTEFGKLELSTAIPTDGTFRVLPGTEVHKVIMETTDIVNEEERELLAELENISPDLRRELAVEIWRQLGDAVGQQGSLFPLLNDIETVDARFNPVVELTMIRDWLEDNEPDWRTRLVSDRNALIPEEQGELRTMPRMFLDSEDSSMLDNTDNEIAQVQQRSLEMLRLNPTRMSQEIQELDDVPREQRARARAIVEELDTHQARTRMSNLFRNILNYENRFREIAVEVTEQADDAHRLRYEARAAYYDGRLADALEGWLNAMRKWDELLDRDDFRERVNSSEFIRDRIDLAERFLIILDDSNKIFSDVATYPVPFHRFMWNRIFFSDDIVERTITALQYAKTEYEKALAESDSVKRREALETAERYFEIVMRRFADINSREKYMEYAPFLDVRDRTLEAAAYYIRSLESQGKPLPEPIMLRSYIELMLKHDPAVALANEILLEALPLIQEEKYEEALLELDKAAAAWSAILDRYPIIAHDPTNSAYFDIVSLVRHYAEVLRSLDRALPEDFPFRAFLR